MSTQKHPGKFLRELLKHNSLLLAGAHNALSAKQLQQLGAQAVYVSGAAVNACRGLSDTGQLSLQETLALVEPIIKAVQMPAIVDIDTGFEDVCETVQSFEAIGAAGLQIEDQTFPKRCGHLSGKSLVSKKEMCKKIQQACEARKNPSLYLLARSDAFGIEGLNALVDRAKAYFKAGADMIFVEALPDKASFKEVAQLLWHSHQIPLLANMTEFGKTEMIDFQTFTEMGYKIVLFPVSSLRVAMKATEKLYRCLLEKGTQRPLVQSMQNRKELYELLDYFPDIF